jgi:hypothetical protein
MDLNQYGAACRCLLRLRENEGEPALSDAAFIARFLPRHPEWQAKPGLTDAFTLMEVARELGLAGRIELFRDYDRIREEHHAGRGVLVRTERAPDQIEPAVVARPFVTLLADIDEQTFSLWCPYPSGQSDVLPRAARPWWDHWLAIGIVLYRP